MQDFIEAGATSGCSSPSSHRAGFSHARGDAHSSSAARWPTAAKSAMWTMLPVCIVGVSDRRQLPLSHRPISGARGWCSCRLSARDCCRRNGSRASPTNFQKYGVKILLFARLTPGIRAPIFLTAGIMKLPVTYFLFADGIYAIPGVSMLFFLGYWFSRQHHRSGREGSRNTSSRLSCWW